MRPTLKAGLVTVWRDPDTVQIGIDPRRAVAIAGMAGAGHLIELLDGSRTREQVISAAAAHGIPAHVADRVLGLLAEHHVLDQPAGVSLAGLPRPLPPALAAELATVSLALGKEDGGAGVLARRRAARVLVCGEPRIGRAIRRILVTAGVGRVTRSASPDGDLPRDGLPADRPDLVIVVGRVAPEVAWRLVTRGVTHLAVSAAEAIGVVGPLVIPGRTACLRCLDYARARADPAWPLILAQLGRRQPEPGACDAALAAAVAAQAAGQALTAMDRAPADAATVGGTLELVLPGWQWRRRSWPRHPSCPCASHQIG